MKRNFFKLILAVAVAAFAGYNVHQSNLKTSLFFEVTLDDVEALAGCEVSSDMSKNKGICVEDVNNGQEYCVTGSIWGTGPSCSGTI